MVLNYYFFFLFLFSFLSHTLLPRPYLSFFRHLLIIHFNLFNFSHSLSALTVYLYSKIFKKSREHVNNGGCLASYAYNYPSTLAASPSPPPLHQIRQISVMLFGNSENQLAFLGALHEWRMSRKVQHPLPCTLRTVRSEKDFKGTVTRH